VKRRALGWQVQSLLDRMGNVEVTRELIAELKLGKLVRRISDNKDLGFTTGVSKAAG
jgi:hypothetical protein